MMPAGRDREEIPGRQDRGGGRWLLFLGVALLALFVTSADGDEASSYFTVSCNDSSTRTFYSLPQPWAVRGKGVNLSQKQTI